jgi:hypothetical protein
MKKLLLFLLACGGLWPAQAQGLSEFQKRQAAQQVKQVLKDFESAFSLHVNPAVISRDERDEATNRMQANVRDDARFENDLVPNNRGSRMLDFKEYQRVAFVNYKAGRGLTYSLEWEEAELRQSGSEYLMLFYGTKTLLGTYQGQVPLRIEGQPCRAGVFLHMRGSTILEARIGLFDTDLSGKGQTFSLSDNSNPLDFYTLPEALNSLAFQVAGLLPNQVVKKISIETFSYQGRNVLNDFSHQVTGTIKASLVRHNPDIQFAVITRSMGLEPHMTLRGSYEKAGNFLKIQSQLFNQQNQPVGKVLRSDILLLNLAGAPIEPPAALVAEAAEIQEVLAPAPLPVPSPVPSNSGITISAATAKAESELQLELGTNKGYGPQTFAENDTMTVSVRVNRACTIRLVYRDAAKNLVLLQNQDFRVQEQEVDRWIRIPTDFVCAPPFGVEVLLGFATTGLFGPLRTEEVDGYRIIKDSLKKVKEASSGNHSNRRSGESLAERSIQITTHARR